MTMRPLPNSYSKTDWTGGLGDDWVFAMKSNATPTTRNDGVRNWLRVENAGAKQALLMPKFVIGGGVDFTVEIEARVTGDLSGGYFAATLYCGEWNYCGIYVGEAVPEKGIAYGDFYVHDLVPGPTGVIYEPTLFAGPKVDNVWQPDALVWQSGDLLRYRIEYQAAVGKTILSVKKNGGEWFTAWDRNDDATHRWPEPLTLWLMCHNLQGAGSYVEWGDITINRSSSGVIVGGGYNYYPWGDFGAQSQANWGSGWPAVNEQDAYTPVGYGFWREGSTEGAVMAGGIMGQYFEDPEAESTLAVAKTGGPVYQFSDEINLWDFGLPFHELRLLGKQAPGVLRVWVVGPVGNDAPISGIPSNAYGDNVTGFLPNGGSYDSIAVNLTGISESTIRLKYQIQNTTPATVFAAPDIPGTQNWPTVLHGFVVEAAIPPPFSPPAGSYPDAVTVTLYDPQGGQIIYTDDGSNPLHYIPVVDGKAVFVDGEVVLTDEPYPPDI